MPIHYETHHQEEDYAPSAQRSRYQHLRGSFRRALAETAGKEGSEYRRLVRNDWDTTNHHLSLGKRGSLSHQSADIPYCRSPRNQNFPAFGTPEKIIYRLVNAPLVFFLPFGKMSPVIQNIGSPNRLSPALRPARFVSQQKQPIAEGRGFFTYTAGHGKASLGRARRGTAGSGVDGTGKA